ncbi:MAG: DUF4013 domain-containing protein [Anaerolineae bacterium]|nr:DUF4013 domain-containing protein [Anaerolineae bacterium]
MTMGPDAESDRLRPSLRGLLTFPFADPGWAAKATVGGLLTLGAPLVVPGLLVLGYLVEVTRLAVRGSAAGLPKWRPLGARLRDGWRLGLAGAALGWPSLLALSTLAVGPLIFGGPLEGSPVAGLLASAALMLQPLGLLWFLLLVLLGPVLLIQAATGSVSPLAVLRRARAEVGPLVRLWLRQAALLGLAGSGVLVAGVGLAFTLFWALLGVARLSAELGRLPVEG